MPCQATKTNAPIQRPATAIPQKSDLRPAEASVLLRRLRPPFATGESAQFAAASTGGSAKLAVGAAERSTSIGTRRVGQAPPAIQGRPCRHDKGPGVRFGNANCIGPRHKNRRELRLPDEKIRSVDGAIPVRIAVHTQCALRSAKACFPRRKIVGVYEAISVEIRVRQDVFDKPPPPHVGHTLSPKGSSFNVAAGDRCADRTLNARATQRGVILAMDWSPSSVGE